MFEITIETQKWPEYENPVCAWQCPMCKFRVYPDLDKDYVEVTASSHLKTQHAVVAEIKFAYKER